MATIENVDEFRRYLADRSAKYRARVEIDVTGTVSSLIGIGTVPAVALAWMGALPLPNTEAMVAFALVVLLSSFLSGGLTSGVAHGVLCIYHRRTINGLVRVALDADPYYRRMELIVGAWDDLQHLKHAFNEWRHGVIAGYITENQEALARWNAILDPAHEILNREIRQISTNLGAQAYAERRAENARITTPETDLHGKLAELTGTPLDLPPLPSEPVPMPSLEHEESLRTLAEELRGHRARSTPIVQRT